MKKIKFMMIAVAGIFALSTAGVFGYDAYHEATMTAEERLFQANLEALTNGEEGEVDRPCDNVSGYRQHNTNRDQFLSRDCCYKEVYGYGTGNCPRM